MAVVAISDSILTDIADAIRSKNGQETLYKPSEMPDAIEAISGGGITPTGTIEITQNGVVDVTNYASADVDVSGGITPTGTKQISITQNGTTTEDVTNYANAEITVNVSGGGSSGYDIDSGNFYALCDKFATDHGFTKVPITIASDLTDYYTVTHNLGTVPTDCFLYPVSLQASTAGYQLGYTHDGKFGQDNSGNRTYSYVYDAHTAGYLVDKTFISLLGSITRNAYNFAKNATTTTVDIRGGTNSSTKLLAGSYILAVK